LSSDNSQRHDQLCAQVDRLLERSLHLDGEPSLSAPGWFVRRRLRKASRCILEILELNPGNWIAMMNLGKIHQRFEQWDESFQWLGRALSLAPMDAKPPLAKDAGLMALELGRYDVAIEILQPAARSRPEDAAIQINLGLSLLLRGHTHEAIRAFDSACASEADNRVNHQLAVLARNVDEGRLVCPANLAGIEAAL
jgi:tetratricopeptide (TPR) repeat protein